jgi:hypothetical protein
VQDFDGRAIGFGAGKGTGVPMTTKRKQRSHVNVLISQSLRLFSGQNDDVVPRPKDEFLGTGDLGLVCSRGGSFRRRRNG